MAKKNELSNVNLGMLGTLRSELDGDIEIDGSFTSLENSFSKVRQAFIQKKIPSQVAAEFFQRLVIKSSDGSEWTLGASTGSWYRREEGASWMQTSPPNGITVDSGNVPSWVYNGIDQDLNKVIEISQKVESEKIVNETKKIDEVEVLTTPSESLSNLTYSILSEDKNSDFSWLDEEWELSGQNSITENISTDINITPEPVLIIDEPPIEPEISFDSPNLGSSPEDFFLKDE